jgi:hypothetical protein
VHLQEEKIRELHLQTKLHTKGFFYIGMKQIRDFSILKHNVSGHWSSGGALFRQPSALSGSNWRFLLMSCIKLGNIRMPISNELRPVLFGNMHHKSTHVTIVALELHYLGLELKCSIFFLCRNVEHVARSSSSFP